MEEHDGVHFRPGLVVVSLALGAIGCALAAVIGYIAAVLASS